MLGICPTPVHTDGAHGPASIWWVRPVLALALCLLLVALLPRQLAENVPVHEDFQVGMTRNELIDRFGEPLRTVALMKTDERVWGPVEAYWSTLPMGARITIWVYRGRRHSAPASAPEHGETELYFLDGADTVGGTAFHIPGAVYEGVSGSSRQ